MSDLAIDLALLGVVALLLVAGLAVLFARWAGQRRDDGDRLAQDAQWQRFNDAMRRDGGGS